MLIRAERIGAGVTWNLITDSEDVTRSIEATRKGSSNFLWKKENGIYSARFDTPAAVRQNLYRISMRCCCLQFKITQTSNEITVKFHEN